MSLSGTAWRGEAPGGHGYRRARVRDLRGARRRGGRLLWLLAPACVGPVPAQARSDSRPAARPAGVGAHSDPIGYGQWTPTGSLAVSPAGHTATLLPHGRVLVAMSATDGPNAELYDPATGQWSPAGEMAEDRSNHTATLLPDGSVLVVGGGGSPAARASTELYDPATGTWHASGTLNEPRASHTATLLPDGDLLVAGGGRQGPSAERFRPSGLPTRGVRRNTGSLIAPRDYSHTATRLPCGLVLVAGGCGGSCDDVTAGAELYDPTSRSWTPTADLTLGRASHSTTLLASGRVLAVGGIGAEASFTADLFDPTSGRWTVASYPNRPHEGHTATLLPGSKVLLAGGWSLEGGDEIYEELSPDRPVAAGLFRLFLPTLANANALRGLCPRPRRHHDVGERSPLGSTFPNRPTAGGGSGRPRQPLR